MPASPGRMGNWRLEERRRHLQARTRRGSPPSRPRPRGARTATADRRTACCLLGSLRGMLTPKIPPHHDASWVSCMYRAVPTKSGSRLRFARSIAARDRSTARFAERSSGHTDSPRARSLRSSGSTTGRSAIGASPSVSGTGVPIGRPSRRFSSACDEAARASSPNRACSTRVTSVCARKRSSRAPIPALYRARVTSSIAIQFHRCSSTRRRFSRATSRRA
jgi:hypothetical protein